LSNMSKELAGKVALVTGAARGIGRATALKLARAGCAVVVNYFNSSDLAETLCTEIQAFGGEAVAIQASVTDAASISELFETIQRHHQQIDILVSNAASGVLKPAMDMSLKHWRYCLETNAFALNLLIQTGRALLVKGTRIVALTSEGSHKAIPNYAFIGASKAALESLMRSLSLELAADGIALNAVCAGAVDTDALKYFPNREQLLAASAEKSLAGKPLTPEDVANAVYLLCLPESAMIMGQTITVDGGYSIIA